jgi:RNA polymerase sigma factor (sigma-70 family)
VRLEPEVEDLLRELTPQVLGALVRRYGHFDLAEDAVQEALLAAARQWPRDSVPAQPRSWLITVASRRLTDQLRSDEARRRREGALLQYRDVPAAADSAAIDDSLTVLFLCCHPALSPASQIALTLRSVGGLSTAQIARAFLVPESTMAQRISRAKQRIKDDGLEFRMPAAPEWPERLAAVLHVLYLVFNEGYASSSGDDLQRADLTAEAIRLARTVHRLIPDDGEATGLLALLLLTDARRAARTTADGSLVPLAEQDRSRWDQALIAEGVALVSAALTHAVLGPYQLQAAIAAVHDEAPSDAETDWLQVLLLYELLEKVAPNPVVTLNRAVAEAMVRGPEAGLALLEVLQRDARIARHHRLHAVRAHLLDMAGDSAGARAEYLTAARKTTSRPERRYLESKARQA